MKENRRDLAFFLFAVAAVLAGAGFWVTTRFQEVEKWPKVVATVERIGLTNSSKQYAVAFFYEVNGNVFISETVVSGKRAWENVKAGSKIEIAYDPKDPSSIFVLASGSKLHRAFFYGGISCAGLAIVAMVYSKARATQ
jgi:hypothetical protein